jgi:hypothetical protein
MLQAWLDGQGRPVATDTHPDEEQQ